MFNPMFGTEYVIILSNFLNFSLIWIHWLLNSCFPSKLDNYFNLLGMEKSKIKDRLEVMTGIVCTGFVATINPVLTIYIPT